MSIIKIQEEKKSKIYEKMLIKTGHKRTLLLLNEEANQTKINASRHEQTINKKKTAVKQRKWITISC